MADYEFKYAPLTGRLTGKQMIEQTEQAINGLASLVDESAGQVEIISTLANEANENADTALEVANEALATTGRTYITVSIPADANDYYDSQLIYIADSTSTNIPVADTGMLEVKTNDDKTACEQVFIADSTGEAYYRNGAITAETVGDVTTYTVTWGGWSSEPASQAYVQGELANYAPLADLANYLPLAGGTMTGDITLDNAVIKNTANDSSLYVYGGDSSSNGAYLRLVGKSATPNSGIWGLAANDGVNSVSLVGYPNGTLNWNSKAVERVNASGTNYIRYESGLQLCWDTVSGVTDAGKAVTFPVAFKDTSYIPFFSAAGYLVFSTGIGYSNRTKTGLTINRGSSSGASINYMVIGYWK